jgi:aryl-alcohol dehydrogenase-like predicted oxidoreductase
MTQFLLGGDIPIDRLGFGAMRIKDSDIVRRAVELGVTFVDTADIYGRGESERLIGEAFDSWPEHVAIGTKGGMNAGAERFRDGRPEYLRRALDASLQRLGREQVELYTLHRHDPDVPIEESIGALVELRDEGKLRHIGVSNVNVDQLARARSVAPIAAVQNEFNRGFLVSEPVLAACEADGIAFMPWQPLGEGLGSPADELRWLLDRSPVIVPIPGTGSIEHLEENMAARA